MCRLKVSAVQPRFAEPRLNDNLYRNRSEKDVLPAEQHAGGHAQMGELRLGRHRAERQRSQSECCESAVFHFDISLVEEEHCVQVRQAPDIVAVAKGEGSDGGHGHVETHFLQTDEPKGNP